MNWNASIRTFHRWTSIVFTLTVAANFAVYATGRTPGAAITYAPLPPLFLLLITGLYLFILPYRARRQS